MRLAALAAICIALGCAGCSSGNGTVNVQDNNQNTIIGRWAADTIQAPGDTPRACPNSVTVGGTTYACGLITMEVFHTDGTYDEGSSGSRGTYSTTGNTLTVTVSGQSPIVYTYSVQATLLVQQRATGSGPVTLRFRRQ